MSSVAEGPLEQLLAARMPWASRGPVFVVQLLGLGTWPAQGWKLHVSATPASVLEVADRVVPFLLAEGVRFKVVASQRVMARMNSGWYGATQVGKAVTVYPSDDEHAVPLALALDELTKGLPGPRVPTDRPLRPDSLVHYRYGAFRDGTDAAAAAAGYELLDPVGRLTVDRRLMHYEAPAGVTDPFEAAGAYQPPAPSDGLLGGRYLVTGLLHRSWKGGVYHAIDVGSRPSRRCVVKELLHDVGSDVEGTADARAWADNEVELLRHFEGDALFPRCLDVFDAHENRYVVLEHLEGVTLDEALMRVDPRGEGLSPKAVLDVARTTANLLACLHERGVVMRDFKATNVFCTPDGGYRLIDFELAARPGGPAPRSAGTPPYLSPEQAGGSPPAATDDVFTWGAVMHHLAGRAASLAPGAELGGAPFPRPPIGGIRPDLPKALAQVIDRAVAFEEAERYATMAEPAARLGAVRARRRRPPRRAPVAEGRGNGPAVETCLARAGTIADALCDDAVQRGDGLCWPRADGAASPDLYSGAAGIALLLAAV
ncbi:MAG TPA: protein kinase, partial [Acidimicrobiales bacterium]|nr:protein kinase [Acidimicrobiales bacterium]